MLQSKANKANPKHAILRVDKRLPKFICSSKNKMNSSLAPPTTSKIKPDHVMLCNGTNEPTTAMSGRSASGSKRPNPKRDDRDPARAKLRMDKLKSKFKRSKAKSIKSKRFCPKINRFKPKRRCPCTDKKLSGFKESSTKRGESNRFTPKTLTMNSA